MTSWNTKWGYSIVCLSGWIRAQGAKGQNIRPWLPSECCEWAKQAFFLQKESQDAEEINEAFACEQQRWTLPMGNDAVIQSRFPPVRVDVRTNAPTASSLASPNARSAERWPLWNPHPSRGMDIGWVGEWCLNASFLFAKAKSSLRFTCSFCHLGFVKKHSRALDAKSRLKSANLGKSRLKSAKFRPTFDSTSTKISAKIG